MSRRKGFTLIELLVVVAIIALLVAILVPTLTGARRQAKVVVCSSNLHQIGAGLAIYLSQWGDYPAPCIVSQQMIYQTDWGMGQYDNRQNLVDIVDGAAKDIYFCPLFEAYRPEDSPFINEWSDYFYVNAGGNRCYSGYYWPMFYHDLLGPRWEESGNPQGGRPVPGDASSAIVHDIAMDIDIPWFDVYFTRPFDWQHPRYSGHSSIGGGASGTYATWSEEFYESNCLYGDGHVTTRTTLVNWVGVGGEPAYNPY